MKIEYSHASKSGNGALVAAAFKEQMTAKDVVVDVHHVREVKPMELSLADLYVFSSPGRFGRPTGRMRRFLKKVNLPASTHYAILTTEAAPKPDKKTGRLSTEEKLAKCADVHVSGPSWTGGPALRGVDWILDYARDLVSESGTLATGQIPTP